MGIDLSLYHWVMIASLVSRWIVPALVCLPLGTGAPLHAADVDGSTLNGVAHVAVRVTDVPKSREFYRTLGWEQAFEFNDAKGTTCAYVKVNDRQFIELYRQNAPTEALGLMHICFEGGDLAATVAAYRKAGLTLPDPRKARAGNLLFGIRDAEGNFYEYTQYLPGSLHMNETGKHVLETRLSDHMVQASQSVKDLAAVTAFFTGKLGFKDLGNGRLGTPGTSGEGIQLEPASPEWKPRLVFHVADVKLAAAELKKRGVAVEMAGPSALVRDPDGFVLLFTAR
jgi:catechol 2,3-dioxygenase-like lactoylglutathione lyase family enzyme